MTATIGDRIRARILIDANGCWIWPGATAGAGYGVMSNGKRTPAGHPATDYVHRLAYEAFVGPIPDGMEIDHLCRVRLCANPAHLEPVTHTENRRRARVSHCKRGHVMTGANVAVIAKTGKRKCRRCDAIRTAELRRRKAEAIA